MGDPMTVSENEFHNIGRIGVQVFGSDASGSVISHNIYIGKGDGDYIDNGIEVGGGAGDVEITGNDISQCGV
ncbi:MAG: hypothetical protein EOM05_10545, partial [Clostridia bacterium]|nr:hypothetical protein [Clostridia bacterium]